MNTPTPEDIRLAEELTECWWLNKEKAQAIIAAHTAPLRERIKELEEQVEDLGYEIRNANERNSE